MSADGTWVQHFHPETKQQKKHLGALPPKEAKTGMSSEHGDKGHYITGAYMLIFRDSYGRTSDSAKKADKRSALPLGQYSGTQVHPILLIWISVTTTSTRKLNKNARWSSFCGALAGTVRRRDDIVTNFTCMC